MRTPRDLRLFALPCLVAALLVGCSASPDADPPGAPSAADLERLEELGEELRDAWEQLPEGPRTAHLQVGDCWGKQDDIDLEGHSCAEPHVYEVVGVVDDFDPAAFEGDGLSWLDAEIAKDEARTAICESAFEQYFGMPLHSDPVAGIAVDATPDYPMMPNLVVCSAHSGPDIEYYRGEVAGSYADRGFVN